jgi:hypothetical protein
MAISFDGKEYNSLKEASEANAKDFGAMFKKIKESGLARLLSRTDAPYLGADAKDLDGRPLDGDGYKKLQEEMAIPQKLFHSHLFYTEFCGAGENVTKAARLEQAMNENKLLYAFISAQYTHLPIDSEKRREKIDQFLHKNKKLADMHLDNAQGFPAKSDYWAEFETLFEGNDVAGGNIIDAGQLTDTQLDLIDEIRKDKFIEVDNFDVYRLLTDEICENTKEIFADDAPPHVKGNLQEPRDRSEGLIGALEGAVYEKMLAKEPRTMLSNTALNKFSKIVKDLAMSNVAGKIAEGMEIVDLGAGRQRQHQEGAGHLGSKMQLAINDKQNAAMRELQNWLVANGVTLDDITVNIAGGGRLNFMQTVGLISDTYTAGYLEINKQVANYLNPGLVNDDLQKNVQDLKEENAELAERGDVSGAFASTHQRRDVEAAREQQALVGDGQTGANTKPGPNVPIRALFALFRECRAVTKILMSSVQQGAFGIRYMQAIGKEMKKDAQPQELDRFMRDDLKRRVSLSYVHAQMKHNEMIRRGRGPIAQMKAYMEVLREVTSRINLPDQDPEELAKELDAYEEANARGSDEMRSIKLSRAIRFDEVMGELANDGAKPGNDQLFGEAFKGEPNIPEIEGDYIRIAKGYGAVKLESQKRVVREGPEMNGMIMNLGFRSMGFIKAKPFAKEGNMEWTQEGIDDIFSDPQKQQDEWEKENGRPYTDKAEDLTKDD